MMVGSYFICQNSLTSHLSGQWKNGSIIEKGVIWDFLQHCLQKCVITVDTLR